MITFRDRLTSLNISAICFALSAVVLGHTLQINNGFYDRSALDWLTGALVLTVIGTLTSRFFQSTSARTSTVLVIVLTAGIAWQIQQLLDKQPGFYVIGRASMALFHGLIVFQALCVAIGVLRIRQLQRVWFPAMLAVSLALGVWMIKAAPDPLIDVVTVHKEALNALLQDKDPYRITFANVYEREEAAKFYNPAAVIGGRLAFAYPYPPLSLLLAVPGYYLFGEYRYSELAWLIIAAALIGYSHRGLTARLAACVLLTTPRIWFVIEQGWTEPIAVFTLALTTFLILRNPIAAGWAAGLLAVTKQYMGFTGLAILRLLWLQPRRWFWIGLGVALAASAVTLPFALWHPHAFMRNVVFLQAQEPFRPDSLSYLSWAVRAGWGQGTFVWAVCAAVAAAFVSLAATRNTAAGFGAAVACTTFLMFAFGSKAFCNYYFFVVGALCATVAAYTPDEAVTAPERSSSAP